MIHMDNAATTWPKPPEVIRAVTGCMKTTEQIRRSDINGCTGQILLIPGKCCASFFTYLTFPDYFYQLYDSLNLAIKGSTRRSCDYHLNGA